MARSVWPAGLAASGVALLLVAGLGNEAAVDAAADADSGVRPLLGSLTGFPAWAGLDSDLNLAIAAKVATLLVGVFFLAVIAGRAGSASAAILAGWGALVVSSAVAGAVFFLVADLAYDGDLGDAAGGSLAGLIREANGGAAFALYTGVAAGGAVALARRTAAAADAASDRVDTGPDVGAARPAPPPPSPTAAPWPPAPTAQQHSGEVPAVSSPSLRSPAASALAPPPPSPAWTPPQSPLPAVPLPRLGGAYSDEQWPDRTASGLPRRPITKRADGDSV